MARPWADARDPGRKRRRDAEELNPPLLADFSLENELEELKELEVKEIFIFNNFYNR
jgi:hypothetical protein